MVQKITQTFEDGEAAAFGRGLASPSAQAPAAGSHIIQFPNSRPTAAALLALEEAIEFEEDSFQSLGSIAVRLVADWSLPRISVVMTATGGEAP